MEPNQNQPIANQPAGEKRSLGPIIGIVIVIILLILGALYVWGGKISKSPSANEAAVQATSSDEVGSIEQDLGAGVDTNIDLSGLDNAN